tara:strand:+ start:199 stop:573 length:375 start_codon:yes stop_codon:yes gene_type:complete
MGVRHITGVKKMIYIRKVTDIADDDDQISSIMFPVENIRGYAGAAADNYAGIWYTNHHQYEAVGAQNTGVALLTLTVGQHRQLATDLAEEIVNGENAMIVLGDDVTGEYFSVITGILSITQNTA